MCCVYRCIRVAWRPVSRIWRSGARTCLARLRRDLELTGDPRLAELMQELRSYAGHGGYQEDGESAVRELVVPLRLRTAAGVLSLFSTTTVFGTAVEVTLSELVLEAFYPADEITGELLKRAAAAR